MSTVVDLDVLKINYLTQAQYEAAISQGIIEEDEIYMTPSSGSGVSDVLVDNVSVVSGGVADIDLSGKADAADIPTKVSDLTNDAGYISSYTETDPVFAASAAHGITSTNISTWNGKYTKPSSGIPKTDLASSVQASLDLADTALQSYTETDPTVPSWAKATTKPSYTASEVGAVPTTRKVNGKALSNDITLTASDVSALPASTSIPSALSDLTNDLDVSDFPNDAGYLTSYTETDPTVPSWAKAANKPTYTASEVGALPSSTAIPSATSDLTNDSGFLNASGILNLFYPIGSYYETSDAAFDPNVSWGGTWVLETEGQVHISAGTNYTVSGALTDTTDGGEATHTLTVAEMPSHLHGIRGEYGAAASGAYPPGGQYYQLTGNTSYGFQTASSESKGGDGAHNNMQPYIVVNRWHRTA